MKATIRIPVGVCSDLPPRGSGGRKIVLLSDSFPLEQWSGVPIVHEHMGREVGRAKSAEVCNGFIEIQAECGELPETGCSWAAHNVTVVEWNSRVWEVEGGDLYEIALVAKPSFRMARAEWSER
jgi:hypothetical protein